MVVRGGRLGTLHAAGGVGGALLILSAVLPWSSSQSLTSAQLSPLASDAARPSVILVLLIALGGAIGWAGGRSTAAWIGLAGSMWLSSAVVVWFAGARLKLLLPSSVVPEGAVMSTQPGLLAGLLGGTTLVAVAVLDALTIDGSRSLQELKTAPTLLGIGLVAGLWWGFSAPWFEVEAQGYTWALGLDAAPLLGDLLPPIIVIASVTVVWLAIAPHRYVVGFGAGVGALLAVVAAGLAVSASAGSTGASMTLRRVGADSMVDDVSLSGRGPWILCGVSVGVVAYALGRSWECSRTAPLESAAASPTDELPY